MTRHFILSILTSILLFSCQTSVIKTKDQDTPNDETLRKFLLDNDFGKLLPDTGRTNLWRDTVRLAKYGLTIYTHDRTGTDGPQFRFLVEDNLPDVFVLKKSGWFAPLTDKYSREIAFERICDSIPIFEPLEYDYQGLENYFSKSKYFKTHPLDLELLDTIVKLDKDFHQDGFVIKDSVKIFQLINLLKTENTESKNEIKRVIRIYLKKRFARMYLFQSKSAFPQLLYIDFDPFYTGDIHLTLPDGVQTPKERHDISKPLHSNSLDRSINMRFIRFNLNY